MSAAQIHRWTEPGLGSVNTYWIEGDTGVIVMDGQRELSKARLIQAEIEATGKPILAVFLSHPHPDHFGGLGVFAPARSNIPVYGSQATVDSIRSDRFGLVAASRKLIGGDFPAAVTIPTHIVHDGDHLQPADIQMTVRELGAGEAECMTALHLPQLNAIFVADAVQHRMTAYLLEGRLASWVSQVSQLKETLPEDIAIYPGHGDPGGVELLDWQHGYLTTFQELVDEFKGDKEQILKAMNAAFPDYHPVAAIPDLLNRDVEALTKEQVS